MRITIGLGMITAGLPSRLVNTRTTLKRPNLHGNGNHNPLSTNDRPQLGSLADGVCSFAILSPPAHSNNKAVVAIGTKRGTIVLARCTNDNHTNESDVTPLRLKPLDILSIGKYPIYSLECSKERTGENSILLYAGCGDRYVAILEVTTTMDGVSSESHLILRKPALGPHTGWVKAVVARRSRLYSIGCNRIEGWEVNEAQQQLWDKVGTIAVESSTEGTCTLSSDLLCLAMTNNGLLVAGGVDGRLHVFRDSDLRSKMPQCMSTVPAHEGRINAVAFEPTTGILVSASHDETIVCWRFGGETIVKEATLQIPGMRALCCTCWYRNSSLFVAAGMNDGSVEVHAATINPGGEPLDFTLQSRLQVPEQPGPVNSLLSIQYASGTFLLIGHAKTSVDRCWAACTDSGKLFNPRFEEP